MSFMERVLAILEEQYSYCADHCNPGDSCDRLKTAIEKVKLLK